MWLAITLVYCLWCRVQCLQGATVMDLNDNDGFGGVWRAVMLRLQVSYTSTKHQLPIFCISTPPLCSDREMFISCSFISYYQLFSTRILHIDPPKFSIFLVVETSPCNHTSLTRSTLWALQHIFTNTNVSTTSINPNSRGESKLVNHCWKCWQYRRCKIVACNSQRLTCCIHLSLYEWITKSSLWYASKYQRVFGVSTRYILRWSTCFAHNSTAVGSIHDAKVALLSFSL